MYMFFLIMNIMFSSVFFIFWSMMEGTLFLIIWMLMFMYFNPFIFNKQNKKESIFNKMTPNKENLKTIIWHLQKASYFLSFLLFYIALYWISFSFWWSSLFFIFAFSFSLILFIVFISTLKKQNMIMPLVFRSNFMTLSMLYLILFIFYTIYPNPEKINLIFLVNSFLMLGWLVSIVFFDTNYDLYKKGLTYVFLLIYLFILLFFYMQFFFTINFYTLFMYLWLMCSILYFEYFPKMKEFANFTILSSYSGVILNYIVLMYAFIYLLMMPTMSFDTIFFFFVGMIFNYMIHYSYQNYFSLFFALITIVFLYMKTFIWVNPTSFIPYTFLMYVLPFALISYTYIFQLKHQYDSYFFHYIWMIFSVIAIIYYFMMTKDTSILNMSVLLLLQWLLLFFSFVKFKKE